MAAVGSRAPFSYLGWANDCVNDILGIYDQEADDLIIKLPFFGSTFDYVVPADNPGSTLTYWASTLLMFVVLIRMIWTTANRLLGFGGDSADVPEGSQ